MVISGCSNKSVNQNNQIDSNNLSQSHVQTNDGLNAQKSDYSNNSNNSNVIQKQFLDSYKPQKTEYNFYFTYKIVHSWWDAVALGMEDAVRQFETKGIFITYDYRAPEEMSANDQIKRIKKAADLCLV